MVGQLGTALGMLLFVPLGDTREKRGLITLLLIGATDALVLVATARNAVWLAAACFLVGAMGSTVHIFLPFAANLAAPRERGRVLGTVFSGILLGILLARTFSGFVGAHLGWRAVFWIAAGMMLVVIVFVQFLLPRSKPTVDMSYISLLRSTVDLVRKHPALRESAFFGASRLLLLQRVLDHIDFSPRIAALPLRKPDSGPFRASGCGRSRRRSVHWSLDR